MDVSFLVCYFAVSRYFIFPLRFSVSTFNSCFMEVLALLGEAVIFEILFLMGDCLGATVIAFNI